MFEIRHVQPEDIFPVIKIAFETLPERYSPEVFNRFYESFPEGFLIAEKHHKVIGFIVGIKTSNEAARITMLSVNKNYRKKGIGSTLLTQFLKEMTLQNIKQVELEVRINNDVAIKFYKKHGFDIIETVSSFYQTGEDAYIMKRVLRTR
ncbi:MAG: ribosomal protein S18-alanine N-acetyltransferase [Thermoplasmatales archaeon]|nr:MAG: ribosomal protein S18-alanine N-acetyltransferase [Thermoplasmatales archaeon]